MVRRAIPLTVAGLLATFLTACGTGSPVFTDPTPDGTLVYSGTFDSLNGKTTSGSALVYQQDTVGTYIVRLEGFSVSDELPLHVWAATSVSDYSGLQGLKGITGNMNYTVSGLGASPTFSSIRVGKIPATISTNWYGSALLLTP